MNFNLQPDRMTKDERWMAMLNRQQLDRIPVHGFATGFAAIHCGLTIADGYKDPQNFFKAITKTADDFGWQDLPVISYATMGGWEFGGEINWPTGEYAQAPTIARYPVNSEKDVYELVVPDVKNAGMVPAMMTVGRMQAERPNSLIEVMVMGPWGLASNVCGSQTLLRWSIKRPELVHELQRKTLQFSVGLLRYFVATFGPDRLLPWVGGTKHFETFYLPYMKELYEEVHKLKIRHIFCHICGEQNSNLPYFSQLDFGNPGILSFGPEVDIEVASNYFPKDIIMGNISPSTIMTETPEVVYKIARQTIEKGLRCQGGFMLSPGCELPPYSPEENLWAIMQAVSDCGYYN
jgi:uroporphyrinogen decarboxylase